MKTMILTLLRETVERLQALEQKYQNIDKQMFLQLLKADPTTKEKNGEISYVGPYAQWIIRQYQKNPNIVNRLQAIRSALTVFHDKKQSLFKKDINQIPTVDELISLVGMLNISGDNIGRTKSEIKQRVLKNDVVKVYESDNWLLLSPKTMEASNAIAGPPLTRWCTSTSGKGNLFDTYSQDNELIIFCNKSVIPKEGRGKGRPKPMFQLQVYMVEKKVAFKGNKTIINTLSYAFQDANKHDYPLRDFMRVFPEIEHWVSHYFRKQADKYLTRSEDLEYFETYVYHPLFTGL